MTHENISIETPSVADIQSVGAAIGRAARGGDLVMLTGPLGAGKTTMTQGIARGLGIAGAVASPTFVIAQIHHGDRLDLVHVDAYRLTSMDELDALDLDTTLDESLTVVEWGQGKVEVLTDARLEIVIARPEGADAGVDVADLLDDAPRTLSFFPHGERGSELLTGILADPDVVALTRGDES